MSTSATATATNPARFSKTLRTVYFVRFAFAIVWAVLLFLLAGHTGPALTVLVVLYPLVDAAAVFVQVRSEGRTSSPRPAELINVILSTVAAIALGWTSTVSVSAALITWGAWAFVAGALQLITAILRRSSGGQIPLIISGAISVLAGCAFTFQGVNGATVNGAGVGGYAVLGGIFFLIAAIRLTVLLRRAS